MSFFFPTKVFPISINKQREYSIRRDVQEAKDMDSPPYLSIFVLSSCSTKLIQPT